MIRIIPFRPGQIRALTGNDYAGLQWRTAGRSPRRQEETIEKPKLEISQYVKGEAFTYQCSLCGQAFLLPEDRNPKEAMKELWTAFNEHVREVHGAALACEGDAPGGG